MKVNKKILLFLSLFLLILTPIVFAEEIVNDDQDTVSYITQGNDIREIPNPNPVDTEEYNYENEETNYTATIDDGANLLTPNEKHNLMEKMKPLTDFGHIAFVSIDENDWSTSGFADDYFHSHYNTESGSIFLIDMDNREIYIFSDGNNYRTITNSKAYTITDNVYHFASNEDYYNCAAKAFDQMYELLMGRKIAEPMRNTSNIFVALTLSFFISFIIVLSKTKIKKASDRSILKHCDITFNIGETNAVKNGSHREYSPVSDSSGGGSSSGGGGGGGGGSSGGGGGHSF